VVDVLTGKAKRDDFTIEATDARKRVLEAVLTGAFAGRVFSNEELTAYHELAHDGLVHGEYITGRGHAAAEAWGLIK
jgi:hypothetical protein